MKKLGMRIVGSVLVCVLVGASLLALGHRTTQFATPEKAAKSEEILYKLRQLDVLNRVVPLLLTKAQFSALLNAVDKCRQAVRKTEEVEYTELVKMAPDVTALLDKDLANGDAPGIMAIQPFALTTKRLGAVRSIVAKDNEDTVYDAIWPLLDKGQKKAIAGSINPRDVDPKLKIEDMKDEDLVRLLIRDTLLDPQAYSVLVSLSKLAK